MFQISVHPSKFFLPRFAMLAVCLGTVILAGCRKAETPKPQAEEVAKPEEMAVDESKVTTGREALNRMIIVYRKAQSYADAGTVHLLAEAGNKKIIDETANFSLSLVKPNKIRVQAYQAMYVCDGTKQYATIEDLPGQVMMRPAPIRVTMKTLFTERMLATAMTQNFGGAMPQLMLLLGDEPIKALLRDAEEPVLSKSGEIEGANCYRVQIKRPDGTSTFWIDEKTFILRRVVLPSEEILQAINQRQSVDRVSVVADFTGAKIDGKVDPKAFQFEVPKGAEIVKFFVPPDTGQLLSKKTPDFKFLDVDGKPLTPESLAGKVAVLDFWASWCGPCRRSLPELQKAYEKFKDNSKVAFYAVSVDTPEISNKDLGKLLEELKVKLPYFRDPERTAVAFKFSGIPTTFVIGPDGIVQDCESRGDPKFIEELPSKIEKLLAGENIYEKPLKAYQEQLERYAKTMENAENESSSGAVLEEKKIPEAKTAKRSEPAKLKMKSLWKCKDVKSPGNVYVLSGKGEKTRLAVIDNWKAVAEVGLDGKLIASHKLTLDETELVGSLRSAVDADGKRHTVAFLTTQQRCHILDENWKQTISYPEDALKKPHSGLADVELGDLDGDGKLDMAVSYWGVVGVQGVSLDGKRLWANRSLSNVIGMAIGDADEKGRRNLYCTNNAGSLVALDAKGERQGEVKVPDFMMHWVVAADLQGEGPKQWCAMTAPKLGESLAIGFSLKGDVSWTYPLPMGVQPKPIELIIPGRVTRDGPGQWILPGPDGSVHILAIDGKLLDKFNSGVTLQGLATVEIDGQPVLVIASDDGVEAWKVE